MNKYIKTLHFFGGHPSLNLLNDVVSFHYVCQIDGKKVKKKKADEEKTEKEKEKGIEKEKDEPKKKTKSVPKKKKGEQSET